MSIHPYKYLILAVVGLLCLPAATYAQLTATIQHTATGQSNGSISLNFPEGYPSDQVVNVFWYPLDDSHNYLPDGSGGYLTQPDDDLSTTTTIGNLAAGWYRVSFNRIGWCNPATKDFEVLTCTPPTLTLTPTNACGDGGLGSIALNIANPENYTYLWSNGATTQNISGLLPNTYSVTITDNTNNCSQSANATVSGFHVAFISSICEKTTNSDGVVNGLTNINVVTAQLYGTPPFDILHTLSGFSYNFDANNVLTANIPSADRDDNGDIIPLNGGDYSFTVQDANGCTQVVWGNNWCIQGCMPYDALSLDLNDNCFTAHIEPYEGEAGNIVSAVLGEITTEGNSQIIDNSVYDPIDLTVCNVASPEQCYIMITNFISGSTLNTCDFPVYFNGINGQLTGGCYVPYLSISSPHQVNACVGETVCIPFSVTGAHTITPTNAASSINGQNLCYTIPPNFSAQSALIGLEAIGSGSNINGGYCSDRVYAHCIIHITPPPPITAWQTQVLKPLLLGCDDDVVQAAQVQVIPQYNAALSACPPHFTVNGSNTDIISLEQGGNQTIVINYGGLDIPISVFVPQTQLQNNSLQLSANIIHANSACGDDACNGEVSIGVSGSGSGSYTYAWSDYCVFQPHDPVSGGMSANTSGTPFGGGGSDTPDCVGNWHGNLCSGIYSVTVTDTQTGCTAVANFNIGLLLTVQGNTVLTYTALLDEPRIRLSPTLFDNTTRVNYDLPEDAFVTIKAYNLQGVLVKTLVDNEYREAGSYELNNEAGEFNNGLYLFSLEVCDRNKTQIGIKY
jgi:hypothetical protein